MKGLGSGYPCLDCPLGCSKCVHLHCENSKIWKCCSSFPVRVFAVGHEVFRSVGLSGWRAVKLSVFHSLTRNTHSISQTAQTGRTSLIVYEYSQFLVSETSSEDTSDAAEKLTQIKHAAKSKHFYRHLPLMTSCFAVGCRFILYPVWGEAERGMQDQRGRGRQEVIGDRD